jgi:sulfur-oxidizing protein SoxX
MHLSKITILKFVTPIVFTLSGTAFADTMSKDVDAGKKLAFDTAKGNCLACHQIEGGEAPGNIGPPLIAMQSRFSSKEKLKTQIWDATIANPSTIMPPVGRHRILTPQELDQVVEFIWTK